MIPILTFIFRRHVFTDLQPYVCTFKDCEISSKSFPTRAEWFQHECTTHRLHWSCNWCSQPDTTFRSAHELKRHLNSTHAGMVTEAQMEMVLETCERPIKSFSSDDCPLCADWEPPFTKENAKGFSRHLARHLQQLTLEALPLAIDGLEIRDASGLSDDESLLSHGSGDEEPTNQPDDPPPPVDDPLFHPTPYITAVSGKRLKVVIGTEAETNEPPIKEEVCNEEVWREVTGGPVVEQTGGEAPVAPEVAGLSQTLISKVEEYLGRDKDTLDKAQEEKKKGVESPGASGPLVINNEGELKRGIQEEANAQLQNSKKRAETAPVRFKDAVGRKFSFPFHLCATWQVTDPTIRPNYQD